MIDIFYERIKNIYLDMLRQYPRDTEVRFKSVLDRRFNLRELRAVGVKFAYALARHTKQELISRLWQYFSSRIHLPVQQENDGWMATRRLPTQPDLIPDFASDLDHEVGDEENDIMWYLDSTPSPVSVVGLMVIPESRLHRDGNWIYRRNLLQEFNTVSQAKKYGINAMLVSNTEDERDQECAICYETISHMDLVKLNCSHNFCGGCIKGILNTHNNMYCGPACAMCRAPMTSFSVKNPEIYDLVSEHCL